MNSIIELRAAVARLYYNSSKDIRDFNMLIEYVEKADKEIRQLKLERDAVAKDFWTYAQHRHELCEFCLHDNECEPGESLCVQNNDSFEWRGQCPYNTDAPKQKTNVFEYVKNLGEKEFGEFCYAVYNKGWSDGADGIDDEVQISGVFPSLDYKIGFEKIGFSVEE